MKNVDNRRKFEFQVGTEHKTGKPIMIDLAKCSHVLVAGTTGSGKTESLKNWISQLMDNNKPDDIQFFIIDPKRVEYLAYTDSLYFPANPIFFYDTIPFLGWLEENVNHRYDYFRKTKTLSIDEYNQKVAEHSTWAKEQNLRHFAHQFVIIDEFANLMTFPNAEKRLKHLIEKAGAAGVHMIIATQNPTVEVINSTIKANIATRICFKVASWDASNVVLDDSGGEKLLGRGDMLIKDSNLSVSLIRAQSLFINDKEKASQLEYYKRVYPRAKEIDWEQEIIKWGKAEYNEEGQLELI